MKTNIIIAIAAFLVTLASCSKEKEILPANDRIILTQAQKDSLWNIHVAPNEVWQLKIVASYKSQGKVVTETFAEGVSDNVGKVANGTGPNAERIIGRNITFPSGNRVICNFLNDTIGTVGTGRFSGTIQNGKWAGHDFGISNIEYRDEDHIVSTSGSYGGVCNGPQAFTIIRFECIRIKKSF